MSQSSEPGFAIPSSIKEQDIDESHVSIMNDRYETTAHSKHSCQYHVIWCPKYRYDVLTPSRQKMLKQVLSQIAETYSYELKALEVMPDHVHVFLRASHTVAPVDIVRTLKSISAIEMFKQDPDLKRFYARCGSLWSRGHYISTVGHISEATVKRYIAEQKEGDEDVG